MSLDHPVTKLVRNFLFRTSTSHKSFSRRLAAMHYPLFDNEQEAAGALIELADYLSQNNQWTFDLAVRFFGYNLHEIYLAYAPTYRSFWEMRKPMYLGEAVTAFPPYATNHSTVDDCLRFLAKLSVE